MKYVVNASPHISTDQFYPPIQCIIHKRFYYEVSDINYVIFSISKNSVTKAEWVQQTSILMLHN